MACFISTSRITKQIVTGIEVNSEVYFPHLREYCPRAFANEGNKPHY